MTPQRSILWLAWAGGLAACASIAGLQDYGTAASGGASAGGATSAMGGAGGLGGATGAGGEQSVAWLEGAFTHRRRLVVGTENWVGFDAIADEERPPLPLVFPADDILATVAASQQDIAFTASDGATVIAHRLETLGVNEVAAWVDVDGMSPSNAELVLYVYYGGGEAHPDSSGALWGEYEAVWHLTLDQLGAPAAPDSSPTGATLNPLAVAPMPVAGLVGDAVAFEDLADPASLGHLTPPAALQIGQSPYTISLWTRNASPNPLATGQAALFFGALSDAPGYAVYLDQGVWTARLRASPTQLATVTLGPQDSLAEDAWAHLAATWDGVSLRGYVNGIEKSGSSNIPADTPITSESTFRLSLTNQGHFVGELDEVRLRRVALSREAIALEHAFAAQTTIDVGAAVLRPNE